MERQLTLALTQPASTISDALSGRIAIDGHMIGARESGNETYAAELARALGRLGGHEYLLYTPFPESAQHCLYDAPHLALRPFRSLPSMLRIPWQYPRLVNADGVDLLHVTYIAPPVVRCPVVATVHDVSYRRFPEYFSGRVRLILNLLVGRSVRQAAHVITPSESSREDLVRYYRLSREQISVIPLAAGTEYFPRTGDEVERVRQRYALAKCYLLSVGNIQPRKNLSRLVASFAALAGEFTDLQLVIVGRSTWRGSEVEDAVKHAGLENRVRFIGYVPHADLPALYSGATVFCYPTLFEGFGLPPLEAMACGTPTLTSNRSSLPEVVGDAAVTVDPESADAIAGGLRALLVDGGFREHLRRRGVLRAAEFGWDRTAFATRDVYEAVLSRPARHAVPSRRVGGGK